jgi:hypothetical protein
MHATRDTLLFIFGQVVGGRVMRGVMSPLHVEAKNVLAARQLNPVHLVWIMRAAG